jgi:Pyruvate/2-oxoacid:ferredoxin oxidoreductase delta subunit
MPVGKVRKIIRIDEEKCNGCGQCVPSCAEGAIAVVDGKARLVSETYCDGLGNCLGTCPQDAITIEEREAGEFDAKATEEHLKKEKKTPAPRGGDAARTNATGGVQGSAAHGGGGCPGGRSFALGNKRHGSGTEEAPSDSQLANWPVKLVLAPPTAGYYQGATLVLAADCVPFAYANFHRRFLAGKTLLTACPKFGETDVHLDRLTGILKGNDIRGIEVLFMEVPCCFGLVALARQAVSDAGKDIPLKLVKIGIRGDILDEEDVA